MKNTKCLFDENKMTPAGMVSVSQLQTFLSCRKKWEYNYIENITPRIERSYLTIGRLCHVGMQHAMRGLWAKDHGLLDVQEDPVAYVTEAAVNAMNYEYQNYYIETPHLAEEESDLEKLWDDAESVFRQAFYEFEPWKWEVVSCYKKGEKIPALELHFKVPCPPTKGLHGYIDAILRDKETGFTWCVDYKFRKSFSPDEDEAFNIQNSVYAYACRKMGIYVTGTLTWQHLNTPASDPAILKDGRVSRAKIKTTWDHYKNFLIDHGQDPEDYFLEMEEKLRDIEWCRSTFEYRNDETIQRIWDECVVPVAKQVKAARGKKAKNYKSLYPWNCKMCQYQSLCQAELRGYDVEAIVEREYAKR